MWHFLSFRTVFKVHSCCRMCQYFILLSIFCCVLQPNYIPWYRNTMVCLSRPWLIDSNSVPPSRTQLFPAPWAAELQASLSITSSQSLLRLMSITLVMPSNHLILSSPSPPTFNPSQHQGLFQWVSSSHQVAKILEFQLQHQSFQWIFRTDFL